MTGEERDSIVSRTYESLFYEIVEACLVDMYDLADQILEGSA